MLSNIPSKAGITIFDISTPTSPTVVGYLFSTYFGNANTIKVNGNYAYVIQGPNSWISVVNISNPTDPQLIHVLTLDPSPTNPYPFDIDILEDYAFVPGFENDTLYVIDISNPTSLQVTTTISGTGAPHYLNGAIGVRTLNNYVFVTAPFDHSLTVIDISNPLAPKFVSHIADAGSSHFLGGARHLHVLGNYAYVVAAEVSSLTVVDISNPITPTFVDSIQGIGAPNFLDRPVDVYVSFNHAFVAAFGDNSLSIFEFSPVQAIQDILDELEDLIQNDEINNGQYHSIMSKLEKARKKLEQDKSDIAIDQLIDFKRKVNELIDKGDLSLEEGNQLIEATNDIICQLSR